MSTDLHQLDPAWAWAAYEPHADRPWSRRLAAHLFRRALFGATTAELEQAVHNGPAATIDRLCNPSRNGGGFESTASMLAHRAAAAGSAPELAASWLYRMLSTPDPLLEKLTLFWHGHFATSAAKVEKLHLMLEQNELLRARARGRFAGLVGAISRDPAMLIWLDSTTNRRIRPNENYARELMELFCLGVGNYTERDVKEVARAFTGWEVLGEHFVFNGPQHDRGVKSFLGRSGNFDGDDAIKIILEQPAAPRFIARKLIRFFVLEEPPVSDALIEPIARQLRDREFEIGPALRTMLSSNLFFSELAIGRKVRSPVELGVGLLRCLGAATNLVQLGQGIAELGQSLFYPPNVKGWDGGRAWINSSTLLGRANLVHQIMAAPETHYEAGSLAAEADRAPAGSAEQTVRWLLELLVAVAIPAEARDALVKLAAQENDRTGQIAKTVHAISATPEFQLA